MEKTIKSKTQFLKYIAALDQDEGIKITSKNRTIYILRYSLNFSVIIKEENIKIIFKNEKEVYNFLRKYIDFPLKILFY